MPAPRSEHAQHVRLVNEYAPDSTRMVAAILAVLGYGAALMGTDASAVRHYSTTQPAVRPKIGADPRKAAR